MAKKKQSESVPTSSGRVLRQRKSTTGGEKVDGKDKGKMPLEVKEKAKGNKSGANEAGNGENAGKRNVITHVGNAEVSGSSFMIQPIVFVSLLVALTAVVVFASPTTTSQTITSHTALTSSALTSTLTSTAAFASQTITSPTASTSCSPSTHVVAVSPSAPTSGYCSYQFLSSSATPFPDSLPMIVAALIITALISICGNPPRTPRTPRGPATVRFPKNKKPFPKLQMRKK